MNRSTQRRERHPWSLGVTATLAGGVAFALSMAGQFHAATDHAAAVNAGHPHASAHLFYYLAVTPSIVVSVVALCLGTVSVARRRGARAWGVTGIILGLLTIVLGVLQFPADLMAEHWIRPHPSDFG